MNRSRNNLLCFLATVAAVAAVACRGHRADAGPVSSFADIDFWVGSGANSAAIAIDWDDTATNPPALVWGFRWDGAATGKTMLEAVVTADPRLFAKTNSYGGGLGSALYGLGYDDGDGEFALDDDTMFDEDGFAGSTGPADGAAAVDDDDLYNEGWLFGYWNYGVSAGNPYSGGSWKMSTTGMSSRSLRDGDWDSWTFTATFSARAFAVNPIAATPPVSDDADFNGDGAVDGNDFLAWQRGFGMTAGALLSNGDANRDGAVDGADLQTWREQFGRSGGGGVVVGSATSIPEPASMLLAGIAAFGVRLGKSRRQRARRG